MDTLAETTGLLRRFGSAMMPDLPAVDIALPALRTMLRAAGAPYKLVGGLAVIHHGYPRLTVDIDVLLTKDGDAAIDPVLEAHGFTRVSARRLRHDGTGVQVDLLQEGMELVGPRPAPPLPSPLDVAASERDPDVVALPVLLQLKLEAGRRQDETDVVQLLKRLDDTAYVYAEAAVRAELRGTLASLRDEALEELRWDQANET